MDQLCGIRPMEASDRSFVLATWLNNYKHESYFAARISDKVFFRHHHDVVERLLARSRVLIACDPGDANEIVGYIVWEPGVLHWCYVKKAFRQYGLGRALLTATDLPDDLSGVSITHATKMWFSTRKDGAGLEAKFPHAVYNPYLGVI